MDARKRWRRAIIISITLNVFLLCGVGILSAGIFNPQPVEQLLELDLVSEDNSQQSIDSGSVQANVSTSAPMVSPITASAVPKSAIAPTPVAVQAVTSLSVDEVLTDLTAESGGEAQGQSSSVSGGSSGSSTSSSGSGQASNGQGNSGQGSGSGKSSGGILRPQILSQVHPTYPEAARQAGIAGTVVLKVQILENGRAGDISVKQSSGNDLLDDAAVTAVHKWRFTPAKEKNTGRAVACYTTVPVVFRLN